MKLKDFREDSRFFFNNWEKDALMDREVGRLSLLFSLSLCVCVCVCVCACVRSTVRPGWRIK